MKTPEQFSKPPALAACWQQCHAVNCKEDMFALVNVFSDRWDNFFDPEKAFNDRAFYMKQVYNQVIGWGLPSKAVCEIVCDVFQTLCSSGDIVDFGAGSGIFAWMFHEMGIPKDRIVAVDLPNPTHGNSDKGQRVFWEITRDPKYVVHVEDVLFIAWGYGDGLSDVVDDYVARGGTCVIILGELWDGCTFPSDYFVTQNQPGWVSELTHVVGPASISAEHISVNRRAT